MLSGLTDSVGPRKLPALLMIVFGLVLVGYGAYDYQQQSTALENTVEVNATVTETDVETRVNRGGKEFVPEATFEYRYQDTSYISNNIYPAGSGSNYDSESKARDALAEYAEGETVTAYVNPSSPGRAFLEDERSDKPLTFAAIGGLAVLVAGVHLFRESR